MSTIKELGIKFSSDKCSEMHQYFHYYDDWFEKYKDKNIIMLEIGLLNNSSINLWTNYFKNAFIYGIDINPINIEHPRIKIIKGDQSNIDTINTFKQNINNNLSIIIDDGSHHPHHQLFSFIHLFDCLLPGGEYIIEDIETSYWKQGSLYNYNFEFGYGHIDSIIEIFKFLIDGIHRFIYFNSEITDKSFIDKLNYYNIPLNIVYNILDITFGRNLIRIRKKPIDYDVYEYKKYLDNMNVKT